MSFNHWDIAMNCVSLLIESAPYDTRLVAKVVAPQPGDPEPACDVLLFQDQDVRFVLTFVGPQWHDGFADYTLPRARRNHEMLMTEEINMMAEGNERVYFVLPVVEKLSEFASAPELGVNVEPGDPVRFILPSSIDFSDALTATLRYWPEEYRWQGLTSEPVGAFSTWPE